MLLILVSHVESDRRKEEIFAMFNYL